MLREIKKKMVILQNRAPFNREVKEYFAGIEEEDWIYNNMKAEGSPLSKGQVESILRGDVLSNVPIGEHLMAERLRVLLKKLWAFSEENIDYGLRLTEGIYCILSGKDKAEYRKRSILVREWDFSPALPADIPGEMENFRYLMGEALRTGTMTEECFEYAARLQLCLLKILPYGEEDRLMARAVTTYYLMCKGYPAAAPYVKEQEYNAMVSACLKSGNCNDLKDPYKQEILAKLSLMMQLTAL